ncbi:hypothetical protein P4679_24295 [Priestia megaterium]|uniref:hypothetical protein n=1 Tax=Priestia megaterium TaxID=1404 RepID=UPI002E1F581B|nr:hypothetical protein [Priestia megaterium]
MKMKKGTILLLLSLAVAGVTTQVSKGAESSKLENTVISRDYYYEEKAFNQYYKNKDYVKFGINLFFDLRNPSEEAKTAVISNFKERIEETLVNDAYFKDYEELKIPQGNEGFYPKAYVFHYTSKKMKNQLDNDDLITVILRIDSAMTNDIKIKTKGEVFIAPRNAYNKSDK